MDVETEEQAEAAAFEISGLIDKFVQRKIDEALGKLPSYESTVVSARGEMRWAIEAALKRAFDRR